MFKLRKARQIENTAKASAAQKYAQEQALRPKSKVEALARAYCEELGYNPDQKYSPGYPIVLPMWRKFETEARDALHKGAMEEALRRVVTGPPSLEQSTETR